MRKKFIVEVGRGTDLHGGDSTKAAIGAVQDAIHRGALFVSDHCEIRYTGR